MTNLTLINTLAMVLLVKRRGNSTKINSKMNEVGKNSFSCNPLGKYLFWLHQLCGYLGSYRGDLIFCTLEVVSIFCYTFEMSIQKSFYFELYQHKSFYFFLILTHCVIKSTVPIFLLNLRNFLGTYQFCFISLRIKANLSNLKTVNFKI